MPGSSAVGCCTSHSHSRVHHSDGNQFAEDFSAIPTSCTCKGTECVTGPICKQTSRPLLEHHVVANQKALCSLTHQFHHVTCPYIQQADGTRSFAMRDTWQSLLFSRKTPRLGLGLTAFRVPTAFEQIALTPAGQVLMKTKYQQLVFVQSVHCDSPPTPVPVYPKEKISSAPSAPSVSYEGAARALHMRHQGTCVGPHP